MAKTQNQKSKLDPRQVIYELKENPLHKFKIAFALMSIIPLMVIFYLILVKLFSFSILVGHIGLILSLTIVISILGFSFGYSVVARTLKRLMLYAAKFRESDQLKSTLVANVSHEVRNPLSVVKLTLSNLVDGVGGKISEMQKSIVERCQQTIDRLIRLVNQLLDLSKIEAGKFMMKRSLIDVNSLINNELANFESSLKNKNLQLEKQTPAPEVKIWADQDKIVQVFDNLFGNAVKYTPESKKIFVRVLDANADARIEIEDTGEGIPADKLDKIFDKFERIAGGKELGAGLGLPITKDIVEMHRGRIWAESEVGKGSKFIVLLPKDLRGKRPK